MKIGDLFYETWHALSANKGRSLLTILGIVIGIAAVIAMTSLIAGIQNTLMGEMGFEQARQVSISAYSPDGVTFDDLDKLERGVIVPHGFGIGLLNIHKRIQLIYGGEFGLSLYNSDEDHAVAQICIPRRNYD